MGNLKAIIRLGAIVLTLVLLGGLYFGVRYVQEEFDAEPQKREKRVQQLVSGQAVSNFVPGQEEFEQAARLVALEQMPQAVERLEFLRRIFPSSIYASEAGRMLGEIRMDHLLSLNHLENKKRYVVRRGDSYLKIARSHETSLSNMMMINGLLDLSSLHPGDELWVMPLNFSLRLKGKEQTISLLEDGKVIKVYSTKHWGLPRMSDRKRNGVLAAKAVEGPEGQMRRINDPRFRHEPKILTISLAGANFQLRPYPKQKQRLAEEGESWQPGRGIFLEPPELEELAMLLRRGNEVELYPAG